MRLLTYNIHKGIGGRDRRYRLQRIVDVIREVNAEIVCLQEVDRNVRRSRFDDQPALLGQALEIEQVAFQLNHEIKNGGYGNCTLSSFPIKFSEDICLRINKRKNRRALVTLIETPSGQLRLANWHLGLAEKDRHAQAVKLFESNAFGPDEDLASIVVGDTNDWRDTLKNGRFRDEKYSPMAHPASAHKTFPAYMPLGALDKAFACKRVEVLGSHVVDTSLARAASDHLPVVFEINLRG
ncbi:MAG: endonuclease/exonuclease/phosphatase family protein [Planctomycetota bacterium]|jgi:endonuclease/exonuclease/phosphatase family metal-dependent hydrolase